MTERTDTIEAPTRRVWIVVALLAVLPSAGTLGSRWLADDAAILGYVHRAGPLADWTGSQYGMHLVRFWRPVVTDSWWLQWAWTGISPLPLRLLNLLSHLGCALLAAGIVRRLRGGPLAMLVAGGLVALFPHQGGTVTWIAGRTATLSGFFIVLTAWVALGPRPAWAALFAFLACASKEVAFAVPAWVVALRWAAGDDARALIRNTAPVVIAVLLAFVWRRLALGIWTGGYPASGVELLQALPGVALVLALGAGPILGAALVLLPLGVAGRSSHARLALAGLFCTAASFLPLAPILAGTGVLEPQNARWLFVGDMGLALSCAAAAFPATRAGWQRKAVFGLLVLVAGGRAVVAWRDTHEWAEATRVADERVERARAALDGASPGDRPVLFDAFPTTWKGAYCLGFGAADRFRAPFPATPRPVWPLRPMFGRDSSRRDPVVPVRADGSLWPWIDEPAVPRCAVSTPDGTPLESLVVDRRVFPAPEDESPRFVVSGGHPDASLELVAYTEMGYEPAAWRAAAADGRELSLMQALACSNGTATIGQTLAQAADVGAVSAYLEVRVVDDTGKTVAASPWILLSWAPDLIEELR